MLYKSYLIEQNIKILNKNFILFFGENLGLKNELKKKIKIENKNAEIITFYQEEIVKNNHLLHNEINNISLFESEKIFIIEHANDKIFELIKELSANSATQKIYIFSDLLDKKSKIRNYFEKSENLGAVACYLDNEISIKKIIINTLKGFEGLTTQNVNLIIENSNLNRVKLYNELEKIVTFFQNKKIDSEKLEIILDVKENNDFSLLKDAALKGDKLKTNKLLSDTIVDAENNIFYLNSINQRLNKLFEVKKNTSDLEKIIDEIKPPIFWKDKPDFITQAKKWNKDKIKLILNKTYKLEIQIKSNSIIDKNILMKKLIIDLCNTANTL